MARTDAQFNLRLTTELKDRLDEAARANKRSMTAEVIARLEESFLPATYGKDPSVVAVALARMVETEEANPGENNTGMIFTPHGIKLLRDEMEAAFEAAHRQSEAQLSRYRAAVEPMKTRKKR